MAEGEAGQPRVGSGGLFERLLAVRYIAAVVVVLSLLHALTFLFLGARNAVTTYWHIIAGSGEMERPGLELLHSLDFFLVSLVLMILALGVAKLFLLPPAVTHRSSHLPKWLDVESFSELKFLLWETILTALLIAAMPAFVVRMPGALPWSTLVLPGAILVLALSLYFMKKD